MPSQIVFARVRWTKPLVAGVAALRMMSSVEAQVPGTTLADGSVVPDFGGIWERIEGIRFNPAGELPPFNAQYRSRYDEAMAARNRGERVADRG